MKKVLITGITGFVGSHLSEFLLKSNYQVFGTARPRSKTENIDHLRSKIRLFDADILDSHSVYEVVKTARPDYIFHLAAQSFVPTSWASPANTLETNLIGTVHLFEAVRKLEIKPRIQIACSSEEYGLVKPGEIPVRETNPLRPLSPYAVSKVAMDMLGYQYFQSYRMKIVRTRAFNHTGPRRGESFVCSNFARQIAEIEKGKREPVLRVGNLAAKRDFTDVRDIVRGYLLAVQKGKPGEVYNLCSGRAIKIEQVLKMLLDFSKAKVKVEKDPDRMRPSDLPVLEGDYSKFRKETGWKPKIAFEKTLKDLLDYWRERV
ncbi:MAG TPA: GDP-mannose 4,6-dehydratase [Candidatus Bathyarchaeia archaeon]|nr:GDP-mannose 4,6-dehydratase [Candidatus Bathyarchaeia archaeon]